MGIYLEGHESRRRIWHGGRPDLRLGDAVGRTVLVSGEDGAAGPLLVVDVSAAAGTDQVTVRVAPLGGRRPPHTVNAPGWRRLDDFVTEHASLAVTRALVTPGVRWPGVEGHRRAPVWLAVGAGLAASLFYGLQFGTLGYLIPLVLTVVAATVVAYATASRTAIHREGNKRPYRRGHVVERLLELPATPARSELVVGTVSAPGDGALAAERVARVKETYGALLSDVAYRIENSALFDPAVGETREFTVTMAAWDDGHAGMGGDEAAALSREVELTFDAARAQAEALGMGHLPEAARAEARRAAKAARVAQRAATEAERIAAIEQTNRILASLALYYLPGRSEAAAALGGRSPQIGQTP